MNYGELISVIVPVHNRAHLVGRSVGSLIAQSYRNIEILLVDDCSTDDLPGAVAALNDPRVRIIRRALNGGAAAARNTGVAEAKGNIIAFHDSDDICVFDRLEMQARQLAGLGPDYIGSHCSRFFYLQTAEENYAAGACSLMPSPTQSPLSGDLFLATVKGNFVSVPTMMLRKEAFTASGGFDEGLRNNEDWDFALRLTRVGHFGFIPDPLYLTVYQQPKERARLHISGNDRFSAQSFVKVTGKLRRAGVEPRRFAHHYATAARFLLRNGKQKSARRFAMRALRAKPTSLPIIRAAAFCLIPAMYRLLNKRR
ncbi:MAG: glycosyltransferase family A protein [Paracoccaceae bacterium]